jgi:SAM-dependent methyltransferase
METCLLCGRQGQPLYTGLRDRLFDAPGIWDLLRCGDCGLIWLNPQPILEDIPKLYKTYFTHQKGNGAPGPPRLGRKMREAIRATSLGYDELLPGRSWHWIGRAASLIPLLRHMAVASLMFLDAPSRGKLLDVGCGNGEFLVTMRGLGWDVQGVEADPEAAGLAREKHGLPVLTGTLEDADLPAASFDAITMQHVIEHLPNPVTSLTHCGRLLKEGGKLIVITPCSESLGHRAFRRSWFPLDPPRHLHLFSPQTLNWATRRAKMEVRILGTISRASRESYVNSSLIRHAGRIECYGNRGYGRLLRLGAWAFCALEEGVRLFSPGRGEELLLVARKPVESNRMGR